MRAVVVAMALRWLRASLRCPLRLLGWRTAGFATAAPSTPPPLLLVLLLLLLLLLAGASAAAAVLVLLFRSQRPPTDALAAPVPAAGIRRTVFSWDLAADTAAAVVDGRSDPRAAWPCRNTLQGALWLTDDRGAHDRRVRHRPRRPPLRRWPAD